MQAVEEFRWCVQCGTKFDRLKQGFESNDALPVCSQKCMVDLYKKPGKTNAHYFTDRFTKARH